MIVIKDCIVRHAGTVRILPNEGGFCGDSVDIGGVDVAELLGRLFGIDPSSRGSYAVEAECQSNTHEERNLPEVVITIQVASRANLRSMAVEPRETMHGTRDRPSNPKFD